MKKQKFYLPFIEVIDIKDEIISTSVAPYDPFDNDPTDDEPGWDPFSI